LEAHPLVAQLGSVAGRGRLLVVKTREESTGPSASLQLPYSVTIQSRCAAPRRATPNVLAGVGVAVASIVPSVLSGRRRGRTVHRKNANSGGVTMRGHGLVPSSAAAGRSKQR
jgi:hypothetical protein